MNAVIGIRPAIPVAARTALVVLLALALAGTGAAAAVPTASAESPTSVEWPDGGLPQRRQSALIDRLTAPLPIKGGTVNLAKELEAEKAAAARAPKKARALPGGWRTARVSWYGPGFYGNGMAGGGKLQRDSMVVAHKRLPFGTLVEFSYNGRSVVVPVRDRGPYVAGREFDLGPGTARALGMSGVITVRYRIVGR